MADRAGSKKRQRIAKGAVDFGATGVGIALSAATPLGALATPLISAVYDEVVHRALTKKQERRVHEVADHAQRHFARLTADGEKLRTDDFFEARDGRWSSGEVVEAVLLAAANDPMEMKLTHLGHLLAVAAVTPELDVQTVHWLLKLAEDLTWTQYLQLAIVGRLEELRIPSVDFSRSGSDWTVVNAWLQFTDLGPNQRELMFIDRPAEEMLPPLHGYLSEYRLRGNGPLVFWTLGFATILPKSLQEHVDFLETGLGSSKPAP